MSILSMVFKKLKAFRMTVPSLILLVLASYRALISGYSIQLVGICASVVPFICQFKNFPKAEDGVDPLKDVLSNYLMNLILMVLYLAYMLALTFVGSALIPSYEVNPHFFQMLLLAVCANVVFISALIPICHDLKPMQRIMPGIVLCNAQLVFMLMAADYLKNVSPANIAYIACGFIALILLLTFGFLGICYGKRREK